MGYNKPVGRYVECLFAWQTEHSLMNLRTLINILRQ
jgi:hypothetical protein